MRGGGLAGMVTRTELDTEALAPENAKTLREKVERAGLLEMPDTLASHGHPDELHYELTIEDEGRRHTVRLSDGTLPENVRSLLDWADSVR